MASSVEQRDEPWIVFAGMMLIITGILSAVNGLWALDHKDSEESAIPAAQLHVGQPREVGLDHVGLGHHRDHRRVPGVRTLAARPLDRHHRGGDRDHREHDLGVRVLVGRVGRDLPRDAGDLRAGRLRRPRDHVDRRRRASAGQSGIRHSRERLGLPSPQHAGSRTAAAAREGETWRRHSRNVAPAGSRLPGSC